MMTEVRRLSGKVEWGDAELREIIEAIEAGRLVLDWADVVDVDPEMLTTLLSAFDGRTERFADGLGIWTMGPAIEPIVNAAIEGAPPPRAAPAPRTPDATFENPCPEPELDMSIPSGPRDLLHRIIERDLLGPACGENEELLQDPPRTRYVVGTLAPKGDAADRLGEDDSMAGAGESGDQEGVVERSGALSDTLFASAIGLTFAVAPGVRAVRVQARWGSYDRVPSETHFTDDGAPRLVWRRSPRGGEPFELPLRTGRIDGIAPDPQFPEVCIKGVVREPAPSGVTLVTLFLVNDQTVAKDELLKDRKWVLQPQLEITATDGRSAVFVRRDDTGEYDMDRAGLEEEERAILAMVYRKHAEFAIGHGVAVHARPAGDPWTDDSGWDRATAIQTAVLPYWDVPITEPPTHEELERRFPGYGGFELDMRTLAELPRDRLVEALRRIPATYEKWIKQEEERLEQGESGLANHRSAGRLALERARAAAARLEEGVTLIESDGLVLDAFRFANRAMCLQRLRSVYALRRRRGESVTFAEVEANEKAEWRVFQLAFLLLNIATIRDLGHPRRTGEVGSQADLLWFPTGGGKTEAYLGVAAFAIAVRRLQGKVDGYEGDGGVTVIMRYTLRLLTLQQFQRAAALVCAMESLRRRRADEDLPSLGAEPFRIGLWVGANATPNTTAAAERWVNQERGSATWDAGLGASSPLQLTNCPWCGAKLGPDHVTVETHRMGRGRTFLHCPDRDCDFNHRNSHGEGLPVITVDEEIYRLLPTFLLATVDKFAQMPWKGEVQQLFGRVSGRCLRHGWLGTEPACTGRHSPQRSLPATTRLDAPERGLRPPDLVIQDELHLIAGPLGTLVGLYETAIDRLCTWQVDGHEVRPKVIASTATTRRASEQVHRVFCRQVEIFPPTGLDAADNFFSVQRRPGVEHPGRRYVGVCSPGRSRPSVLIRMYVAVLAASEWLWQAADPAERERIDPYMTLVGYFNSLRELGGMRRLVDDDVTTRAFRVEREDRPGLKQRKMFPESTVTELTSRMRSSQIPEILDRLDQSFTSLRVEDGRKKGLPLDVVLATNMLSVGVDVQRLGLMVVSGQPKATAEYIQATSRVGRDPTRPGLVLTLLNWARPRDLSHYEQFEQYHAVFYRYVEALSVTPYAARALDRGLTGVVASLVRLSTARYNPNHGAGELHGAGQVPELIDVIAERARNTSDMDAHSAALGSSVRQGVAARLDEWGAEASKSNRRLGYQASNDGVTVPLLRSPGKDPWGVFTVPTSMREVEPGVGLVLEGRGLDRPQEWSFAPPSADVEDGQ